LLDYPAHLIRKFCGGSNDDDEWENIDGRHFIDMPFELQAVDAVLATVCAMLSEETGLLKEKMMGIVEEFRGDSSTTPGDNLQEQLRALKNSINGQRNATNLR
jgi:magnesium transporter